jgi:hypothetical protein
MRLLQVDQTRIGFPTGRNSVDSPNGLEDLDVRRATSPALDQGRDLKPRWIVLRMSAGGDLDFAHDGAVDETSPRPGGLFQLRDRVCPVGRSAHANLTLHVAAVALAFFDLRLRFALAIGRQGTPYTYFLLELAFLIAPDVAPIAFLRFNDSAFAGFAFLLRWHFVLPVLPVIRSARSSRPSQCSVGRATR